MIGKYDVSKFNIKNTNMINMFGDLENVFQILEDSKVKWGTIKSNCLGTVMALSHTSEELIYIDTKLSDLIDLEQNYNCKVVITANDNVKLIGIRPCKKGDFRGECTYIKPRTVHLTHTALTLNGKELIEERLPIYVDDEFNYDTPIITVKDRQNKNYMLMQKSMENAYMDCQIAISMGYEDYFHWKIRVKMPEWEKSIEVWINPANIKDVFKLRDIQDGEQRRKALKHIVSAHKRTLKSGETIDIMRYLRGKEKFSQNGYEMTIYPSKDDIKSYTKLL